MLKKIKHHSTILTGTIFLASLLFSGCGKSTYKGQAYFVMKWKITGVYQGGESEPFMDAPGYIEFKKDGTGHFYFVFPDDTLNTDFTYAIEYFASPWPQHKDAIQNSESNGPNRINLYNLLLNDRLMWQTGSINFSIEYIKKKRKMILLYDDLFNATTPFDNLGGDLIYFDCEPY